MPHLSLQSILYGGLLSLLWFSGPASAESLTLTCTLPTQNEGGTPLTDLKGVRFYEATQTGGPYTLIFTNELPAICLAIFDRPAGTYFYVATAHNAADVDSAFSNEATRTVLPPVPAPPLNLVVEPGNLAAFGLSQTKDTARVYQIGTVPADTPCDSSMQFNGKYVVPFDAVEWVGSARPAVVFAACGAG